MKPRKVRLEVWATLNGETGYVWPQITSTPPNFDPKLNKPHRVLRFVSEPYISRLEGTEGSFGTEISDKDTPEVSLLRQRLLESEARRVELRGALEEIAPLNEQGPYQAIHAPGIAHGALQADSTTPSALMGVLREAREAMINTIQFYGMGEFDIRISDLEKALASLRRVTGQSDG